MARIIVFPFSVRVAQINRSRRVFEAQRDLEATQRMTALLFVGALGAAAALLSMVELLSLGLGG